MPRLYVTVHLGRRLGAKPSKKKTHLRKGMLKDPGIYCIAISVNISYAVVFCVQMSKAGWCMVKPSGFPQAPIA